MSERGTVEQGTRRLPGLWTLARDVLSFSGGWALVFMEVQRTELREAVLVFAATVVGVPAAAVAVEAAVGARRSGTSGQPSPPVEPASSPSGSSSP